MSIFDPLMYLKLENIRGKLIVRREAISYLMLTAVLSSPFLFYHELNYFHKDGFLDKVAGLCSILTGFYIASLIGVATLGSSFASMDEAISNGVVRKPTDRSGKAGADLNRREYVCCMFGYLAFVALIITLLSMMLVTLAPAFHPFWVTINLAKRNASFSYLWFRGFVVIAFGLTLSSLIITTLNGLYYLVEKIYHVDPRIDQGR